MVSARPLFALLCVLAAPLAVVTALHVRFCAIFCVRCVCVLQYDTNDRATSNKRASKHVCGLCNA